MASDWWAAFFEGAALDVWRSAHTREENRREASGVARVLGLDPGEIVLDVPCGSGRLALELVALGHRVHGLDASDELLSDARRNASERGLELELTHGDMRALAWSAAFDAVLCAGHSFGYFDDEGNRAFLQGVARALRPGGRFLLEYPLVYELVRTHPPGRDWRLLGERLLLSESYFDERRGRVDTSYTFVDLAHPGGRLEERHASYQVYPARELEELLGALGLSAAERLGGLDGRPFTPDSEEFYLRARRA